jgi:polyphenol oxidase
MIKLHWPAPPGVWAGYTRREAHGASPGFSQGPYAAFNLASHVGDAPEAVLRNRALLQEQIHSVCPDAAPVVWLEQVHGTQVHLAESALAIPPRADAQITAQPGLPLAVLTADCLPVFFCDRQGRQVAVAHAGWRGLAAGVLRNTLGAFAAPAAEVLVHLGPAIGPQAFEVGPEVREAFLSQPRVADWPCAFVPAPKSGHFFADLYQLARLQLYALGVQHISGGDACTVSDSSLYSYRRSALTGRFASLILLTGCQDG